MTKDTNQTLYPVNMPLMHGVFNKNRHCDVI
jgi:hypothetical protein